MLDAVGLAGLGCGGLLLAGLITLRIAVHRHRKWLATQSPAGVWRGRVTDDTPVLVTFDGGPSEGVYRELRGEGAAAVREMGHWAVNGSELRLLVMATDVEAHPRIGQDTVYHISYTGPEEIVVDGPDRDMLKLTKAPEGTVVPIEEWEAESL